MAEFKTPIKTKEPPNLNESITIPPSPFLRRLGYGTGVNVMELVRSPRAGKLRSPWALKMISKRVKTNKVVFERLKAEADLLKRMSHPNIVGFRSFKNLQILYLGMEACDISLGDMIEKKIEDNHDIFLPWQIMKVASDIASGLEYLHTKVQILHGDIKSYNVLVNGDFVICKLCDFGVTLPLDENGIVDQEKAGTDVYVGTEAWSAPEVIHGGQVCDRTDIWALGLTLWEMMALMPPHTKTEYESDDDDDSIQSLGEDLDSSIDEYYKSIYGVRPAIPAHIPEKMYEHPLALFYCCTETAPAKRPSANHLAIAARDMLEQCQKEQIKL